MQGWVSVFNDLKNRGVKDILITCHDNISGFGKALETTYQRTGNQLCIVHQIRNSLAFVNWKDRKAVAADLKRIYSAASLDDEEYQVEGFHKMLRKYTKTKTMFPTDDALVKSIYMSILEINKKWTASFRDWADIWGEFTIFFDDRLKNVKTA